MATTGSPKRNLSRDSGVDAPNSIDAKSESFPVEIFSPETILNAGEALGDGNLDNKTGNQATPGQPPSRGGVSNGHPSPGASVFHLGRYTFKAAESKEEFEAVHHLNYETFVQEIQQHAAPGSDQLVDKFHDKNTYFIAKRNGQIAGMVAVHDEPPFSIESRLPDRDILREFGDSLLEIRLLAVQPGERNSLAFAGLVWTLYNFALEKGYSHLLISGVSNRVRLYERLGFQSLGPGVQQGEATFVPMVLDLKKLPDEVRAREPMWMGKMKRTGDDSVPMTVLAWPGSGEWTSKSSGASKSECAEADTENTTSAEDGKIDTEIVSFLPGPVQIDERVTRAFAEPPISHRDRPFIVRFERTRRILSEMVGGFEVAIMPGSGTLSNDVIASNLAADRGIGRGIVLVNGEFGHRLVSQVSRVGLDADTLEWTWGDAWDYDRISDHLKHDERINWVWGVHLESSTGMINDIQALRRCADSTGREIKVCADCVSSLGAVPIDPTGLHIVSGASGKSVGSYAGVAIVFALKDALASVDSSRVPNYFDLRAWIETDGPRFTFPSPILLALDSALDSFATVESRKAVFSQYRALGEYVRRELRRVGVKPLVEGADAAPVITTFDTPFDLSCEEFLSICRSWGYELSGLSGYLAVRKWAQIATMGTMRIGDCAPFFTHFEAWLLDYKKKMKKS